MRSLFQLIDSVNVTDYFLRGDEKFMTILIIISIFLAFFRFANDKILVINTCF